MADVSGRAVGRGVVILAAIAAILPMLLGSAHGFAAAAKPASKCPPGGLIGGSCVALHVACAPRQASLYAQLGLVCRRGRLAQGGLALQREGGAFAVGPTGHVGLPEAEQAFIAAFGPLPGVTPIPGAVKLPPYADVTGPLAWISADLARLTGAQRAAVGRVLARAGGAHAASAPDPLLTKLEGQLIPRMTALTGVTLPFTPTVRAGNAAELGTNPYGGGPNGGFTVPVFNSSGAITGCRILILQKETASIETATNVLGHELTHCYQFVAAKTAANFNALPTYFVEGFAEWAGDELEDRVANLDPSDPAAFDWINLRFRSLFARDYDAFPLFDEVAAEIGGPGYVWAHFAAMVHAGGAAGIYNYLRGIAAPYFERNLATNPLLDSGLGAQWTFDGVGLKEVSPPALRNVTIGNGASTTLGAPPLATDRARLDLEADIVTIAGDAPGGLHLSDGRTLAVSSTRLCELQGGCMCPDGTNPVDEAARRARRSWPSGAAQGVRR